MYLSRPRAICASVRALLIASSLLTPLAAAHADDNGSVTEHLIELLVQKGVLPKDQASALLKEAQREAHAARKPNPAARAARTGAGVATPEAAASTAEPIEPGDVRVTYVPDTVRDQIADQVQKKVMEEAKAGGWAQPNVLPDWVQRLKVYGDLRLRGQLDNFDKNNFNAFPNFEQINNSGGFNTNPNTPNAPNPPLLNTTQNRTMERVRARIGVIANVDDWITGEIRIATGNDSSPVSTNQTFGTNGGDFSKGQIWLDLAYLRFDPNTNVTVNVGRMPNPFFTSDLLYYNELNFDGIAVTGRYPINDHIGTFLTAGAFPVFNTALNFSSANFPSQASSRDQYLFAIQGGGDWRISNDYAAKLGVGYFNYSNVQGKTSSPCEIILSSDVCSTDLSRANFIQFGNTLYGIRNLVVNPNNPTAATPQLYGLASQFGVLDVHGRFDINKFAPIGIALEGDFVKNLSFNRSNIISRNPVNNTSFNTATQATSYLGGDTGYLIRVTAGTSQIAKLWDWNAYIAYKYLESDAVLDALTDPDFHLGGTNAKGYIVGGNLGIGRNTWLTAKFMSANQVSGPTYAVDVLQFDLNSRF